MVGEPGSGSGTPGANAGAGQGTGGTPGAGTGAPAGGGAGSGAGTGVDASRAIQRDRLNPVLSGMSEEQMNETFDALMTALSTRGESAGTPAHARPVETTTQPAREPISKDELKEMLDPTSEKFDPQAALGRFVEDNYGGLITDMGLRTLQSTVDHLEREIPGFKDFKKDVWAELNKYGPAAARATADDVLRIFFTVKGLAETKEALKRKNAPPTTSAPTPQAEVEDARDLSPEEERIARVMYRGRPDPIKAFKETKKKYRGETFEVGRVPGERAS